MSESGPSGLNTEALSEVTKGAEHAVMVGDKKCRLSHKTPVSVPSLAYRSQDLQVFSYAGLSQTYPDMK